MNDEIQKKVIDFFSQFPSKKYPKGTIIINPEQNPLGAYYIKNGHVRQYSVSKEGVELTIHIFAPQSYFPMTWVISNIDNRYYYESTTDVECYIAPKNEVLDFLKNNPIIFFELTRRLLNGLDKLSGRIESLIYDQADKKLISTLLFLARHFSTQEKTYTKFTEKFTHKDIAAFAGISRETTSRAWERLEKKGLITYDKQIILIPDVSLLEKFLNE